MILILLFYILCWIHLIYRIKTGGQHEEFGPGPYCCDERCITADTISGVTVLGGSIIIIALAIIAL
jgi:hypothetical protein